MCIQKEIHSFVNSRPESISVYGYGSGVFKQTPDNDNPQIDLIFIVDDIEMWHQENMILNPRDYSLLGRIHFNTSTLKRIKGYNNITYFSQIKQGPSKFKYGVIEIDDFTKSLTKWDNLFVAGRFHKPVLEIKSNHYVRKSIRTDRDYALAVSCLMLPEYTDKVYLLKQICSLSYMGDTRMLFAENPYKVSNIVLSNYKDLNDIYIRESEYLTVLPNGLVVIDRNYILTHILELLPETLIDFLAEKNTNLSDFEMVKNNISEFFITHNHKESAHQTMEGFRTNGIVRSVPYIFAKVNKRINPSKQLTIK